MDIGSLEGPGGVVKLGFKSLRIGTNNLDTTFAGQIRGGGMVGMGDSITKVGAGTTTLSGANTYTGGTNVEAGTLRVTRLHSNNPVNVAGGKLQVMDSSPTLPAHPPATTRSSAARRP